MFEKSESVDVLIGTRIDNLIQRESQVQILIVIAIRTLTFLRKSNCGCSYHYDDKYLALEIPFIFKVASYLLL